QGLANAVPALERHLPSEPLEIDRGDAPRLPDRGLAARKRDRLEVREPLERREVAAQQLAAPQRAVRSVAGSVEHERERRPPLAVLGETGSRVGVVDLDAAEL